MRPIKRIEIVIDSLELSDRPIRISLAKVALIRDTIAGRREHVANVQVHPSVAIIVTPADGHARTEIHDAHAFRHVDKACVRQRLVRMDPFPKMLVLTHRPDLFGDGWTRGPSLRPG